MIAPSTSHPKGCRSPTFSSPKEGFRKTKTHATGVREFLLVNTAFSTKITRVRGQSPPKAPKTSSEQGHILLVLRVSGRRHQFPALPLSFMVSLAPCKADFNAAYLDSTCFPEVHQSEFHSAHTMMKVITHHIADSKLKAHAGRQFLRCHLRSSRDSLTWLP